jgi:hypothetical protein
VNLRHLAAAYIAAIDLEERLRVDSPDLADEAGSLRGELHALFMDALRESGTAVPDRAEATRIAYQITSCSSVADRT